MNLPPVASRQGDIDVVFQPLKPAGGHAVAWKSVPAGKNRSIVYASVGFAKSEAQAVAEAVAAVRKAEATGLAGLSESHQAWWHAFWPEGFITIPDTRLESFYYIQMYKMASATRPGRPAIDLMGPWFRTTPWAKIWWNLNIQLSLLAAAHRQPAGTRRIAPRTTRQQCRHPGQKRRGIPGRLGRHRPHVRL